MKKSELGKYLILFNFCLLVSCNSSDFSNPAPAAPPTDSTQKIPDYEVTAEGSINGRAWKFASGAASFIRRNNKDYLEIRLWNQPYRAPCEEIAGSSFKVRLLTQNKVGVGRIDPNEPFSLAPTIMFSDMTENASYRNNMIANSGEIRVNEMTNDKIKGSVVGAFIAENVGRTDVLGKFEVPICKRKKAFN
jgi:hypothetical protein